MVLGEEVYEPPVIEMPRKKTKSARAYEKRKAKEHRGRHLGGSGEPDYTRGEVEGEVKAWNRPMGKNELMKEIKKGRQEITAKSGFTEEAIIYAKRYRPKVKLFHKKKRVA